MIATPPGEGEERVPGVRARSPEHVEGCRCSRGNSRRAPFRGWTLPAPFSPMSPWISPERISSDTSRRAPIPRRTRPPIPVAVSAAPCGHRPPAASQARGSEPPSSTELPGTDPHAVVVPRAFQGNITPVRRRPAPPRRGAPSDHRCPRPRRSWSRPRSPPRRAGARILRGASLDPSGWTSSISGRAPSRPPFSPQAGVRERSNQSAHWQSSRVR